MTTLEQRSIQATVNRILLDLRRTRSDSRVLDHSALSAFESELASIPSIAARSSRDSMSLAASALIEIEGAIDRSGGCADPDLSAEEVRHLLRLVLIDAVARSEARRQLADRLRSRNVTVNQLRRSNGLEEVLFSRLASEIAGLPENAGAGTLESKDLRPAELVFALVLWLGTDEKPVVERLKSLLREAGYLIESIKMSTLLAPLQSNPFEVTTKEEDLIAYLSERMDAGDAARSVHPSLLAELAVEEIRRRRVVAQQKMGAGDRGIAYLLDSLMHPAELELLRKTYGSPLFVVAIHEDEGGRRSRLLDSAGAKAWGRAHPEEEVTEAVNELLERNRGVRRRSFTSGSASGRLSVEQVFQLADVFVDVANPATPRSTDREPSGLSEYTIDRFVEQLFSNPYNVPTRHEAAMSHAYSESLRSASVARRVGAAIVDDREMLLSVGMNEVPAFGGGQYPKVDLPDGRDHSLAEHHDGNAQRSIDANDDAKVDLLEDLLEGLHRLGLLIEPDQQALPDLGAEPDSREVARRIAATHADLPRRSRLFDVMEYGRAVHAEMAAILNAMRLGRSVEDAILYCTTFPCHECARHIIMAGIRKVVYVEPFPKSRAMDLHPDALHLGSGSTRPAVEFVPFIGISPRRHPDMYSSLPRKEVLADGRSRSVQWELATANLRDTVVPHDISDKALLYRAIAAMEAYVVEDLLDPHRATLVEALEGR
jgi:cytidine deaminase